jgi:hypothetical protein
MTVLRENDASCRHESLLRHDTNEKREQASGMETREKIMRTLKTAILSLICCAAAVFSTACGDDFCNVLRDEICDCKDLNPLYCEQAEKSAKKADEDKAGLRHRDCKAEAENFKCSRYR